MTDAATIIQKHKRQAVLDNVICSLIRRGLYVHHLLRTPNPEVNCEFTISVIRAEFAKIMAA
jgi:hypothetical protein